MRLPRLFVRLAAQDWLLLAYLSVLLAQVLLGHGDRRATAIQWVLIDVAVWVGVLALTRSSILPRGSRISAIVYRAGIGFPVLASFLQLQYILPTAGRAPVDAQLYAFDIKVFGVEPSEAWDRFVAPGTT